MAQDTHHFFSTALAGDNDVQEVVNGNIILTSYEGENDDNLEVPYIIVSHGGSRNDDVSKDDGFESSRDFDTITVEVTAKSDEDLCELAKKVRACISREACLQESKYDFDFLIKDYEFSTSGNVYDSDKPCYWTTMTYVCETINQ